MTNEPAHRFGALLRDQFQRIRIINLAHRTDRRREVAAQMARIGLAIDGERIAFHPASRFEDAAGFRTPGARGCFHSHLEILTSAREAGWERLLVLEDDVDFVSGIATLGPAALNKLATQDWSLFYGGWVAWDGVATDSPLTLAAPTSGFMGSHWIGWRGLAIPEAAGYLAAMLSRPPGSPQGGPMDVDGAFGWFRRAHPEHHTWAATPELGIQRASRTDVHPLGILDRNPLTRPFMTIARHLKRRKSRSA